ncbi:MAG: hypothetical protein KBB35_03965 [Bacteroidales bacterium]|jgi:ferric-dicitrate binding protein FerR (iron transport regulator)|nr:hypothetical protein [Bacteroidales bacterium]HKM11802.1 FecR domain-containing protein [Bacteroidales bacterium]HPB88813.1 hypothetical protein [Bacteroidales bacterium]HPY21569.1 hypothetical protein [Bacteroidales bacterium]HQA92824.1 hypothetical protein [Bacteroidales bacterium]
MTDFNEDDLKFVVSKYKKGRFDTKKAIADFNQKTTTSRLSRRRWWTTAAAVAASVAIVVAASIGVVNTLNKEKPVVEKSEEVTIFNPDVAQTHIFVYEDAPIEDVLKELSAYYGCTLTTSPTRKHLTATFPDDDIDFIVSLIESALDISINVEK